MDDAVKKEVTTDDIVTSEKRKKVSLSKEETEILVWLFVKTLIPVVSIIVVSSAVLFFGLQVLMQKTSFSNYGISPGASLQSVSQFISAYMLIALAHVFLMILLSFCIIYISIRNVVLPILRITREMKRSLETGIKETITIRRNDKLLIPLVEMINKLK